jgi:hypothetical protein
MRGRHWAILKRVLADPRGHAYTDEALSKSAGGAAGDDFVKVFADKIPKTYGAPVR